MSNKIDSVLLPTVQFMSTCPTTPPDAAPPKSRSFLTNPEEFRDVSRGTPKPFTLKGEALTRARLTPETWRLEIVPEAPCTMERPRRLEDKTAIDLPALEALGKRHGVRFLKAMQCN